MFAELEYNSKPINNNLNELIVVPGHAPFKNEVVEVPQDPTADDCWILASFQRNEPRFYIEHIEKGLEITSQRKDSLLVFSGGFTRPDSKVWSEAATYQAIANFKCGRCDLNRFGCNVQSRIALDEGAFDSFQNLVGSICIFKEITGRNPNKVSVVGWKFKEERFDIHREAIKFPKDKFEYVGVNNPSDLDGAMRGEEKTKRFYEIYPYGTGDELAKKRRERNVMAVNDYYHGRSDLDALFDFIENPKNSKSEIPFELNWR